MLTQQHLAAQLAFLEDENRTVLCLDSLAQECEKAPATNPLSVNRPEDLVYLIYTSGSTGQPEAYAPAPGCGEQDPLDAEGIRPYSRGPGAPEDALFF